MPRERTIRWSDPAAIAKSVAGRSGLEALQAMVAGELPPPPIVALLGITLAAAERGRVVMGLVPGEYHYNPLGSVHGGVLATLLDSAMGCAVQSMLPVGRGYTTLNFAVSFVRPTTVGTGPITAEGSVEHFGRTTALARGEVKDAAGKTYAIATTTCLLFDRE